MVGHARSRGVSQSRGRKNSPLRAAGGKQLGRILLDRRSLLALAGRHDPLGLDQPIPALTAGQQVFLDPFQIRLRHHSQGVKFDVFFAHVGQEIKVAYFYGDSGRYKTLISRLLSDASRQDQSAFHRTRALAAHRDTVGRRRLVVRIEARWLSGSTFKIAGRVHLRSRNDKDFNARYPSIVQALAAMPDETVIDGEIVALDEAGRPSFSALQNHAAASLIYYAFDVMIVAGKDVMNEPLARCRPEMPSTCMYPHRPSASATQRRNS